VAWVDPSSATGHIIPKALLVQNGIDPAGLFVQQDFVGSHDAACRAVAEGQADIGATFIDDPTTREVTGCRAALGARVVQLSIVVQSDEIPNDVLAVRPAFPEDLKGRLLIGATALTTSDAGKKTLKTAFSCDGFSQVKRDDYDAVRRAIEVFRP
jgi:phosphonate transport system substrate-binding protein